MTFESEDLETDYTEQTSTFGDRVTAARIAQGLGLNDLAGRMGVRAETIRAWENDRAEPRANKIQMLAGVLNVPMTWLMSGMGTWQPRRIVPIDPEQDHDSLLQEIVAIRQGLGLMSERLLRLEGRLRAQSD